MSFDNSGSEYTISVTHYNEVGERIDGSTVRAGFREPTVRVELESNFIGPYSRNWLYVSAEAKSILKNKGKLVDIPYRPDMVAVEQFEFFDGRSEWAIEETISEYRAWRNAQRAIIVVSGGNYGGVVSVVQANYTTNIITTTRPYIHNVVWEAVYLVPVVKGYYKSCTIEKDHVTAEIETFKDYVYG